jgi:hypothetical protein
VKNYKEVLEDLRALEPLLSAPPVENSGFAYTSYSLFVPSEAVAQVVQMHLRDKGITCHCIESQTPVALMLFCDGSTAQDELERVQRSLTNPMNLVWDPSKGVK